MTTVIKLGGSLLDDKQRRDGALRKIAARWNAGEDIVLVHGGGKHIDAQLALAGIPKRTHAGLRITDEATLQIVVSVLGGTVNKMLVSELAKLGVRAAGMSGCDGGTLVAEQHPPIDGVVVWQRVGNAHVRGNAKITLGDALYAKSCIGIVGQTNCGELLPLQTVTITGRVVDENGNGLPGVTVTASN